MSRFADAVSELLQALRAGKTIVTAHSRYPESKGQVHETVVSERAWVWREGQVVAEGVTWVERRGQLVERNRDSAPISESSLVAQLYENPSLRRMLSLPEPDGEEVLAHAMEHMREGHVFRAGGAEYRPHHGTDAGEETLRFERGAFVHTVEETHAPPGGQPQVTRNVSRTYTEEELREALGHEAALRSLLGMERV